jgi:hypothetical protein
MAAAVDELDSFLMEGEFIEPQGSPRFLEGAFAQLFHPKHYLAWYRSTQPAFQNQTTMLLKMDEDHCAQHAFITEIANLIEQKLEMLENYTCTLQNKRKRLEEMPESPPEPPELTRTSSVYCYGSPAYYRNERRE